MNTLQLLAYLQKVYDQKTALLAKENTPEYNKEQYTHLMNFYNGKIKELRARLQKQDADALLHFDTDRANEITITEGIELVTKG